MTAAVHEFVQKDAYPDELQLGERTIRNLVTDLETWIDSRGDEGRVKQIETTFEPRGVREAIAPYAADSTYLATVFDFQQSRK